jgi:ATP-dependent Lon protease
MQEFEDIQIPEVVPVMTLQDTVLFPHAVMPLFIFEQRYRVMLEEVLRSHRLFAVFKEKAPDSDEGHEEPPEIMGTVGVVRAAHKNPDGTSNLALQGIKRVRFLEVVQESPYRMIRVAPCIDAVDDQEALPNMRSNILEILNDRPHLCHDLPDEYMQFIRGLDLPGPFIDVTIHSFCQNARIKQQLLETLSLTRRFQNFLDFLKGECSRHDLFRQLQGNTRDEEIDLN